MIKEINRDILLLSQKSVEATRQDQQVAIDLLDTLKAHKDGCVGMAANMIGVLKSIIAIDDEGTYVIMYNPEIMKSEGLYECEEGCLSLDGVRKTKRYQKIKVKYYDEKMKIKIKTYQGFTAQIIQHEIDHLQGIII